MPDSERLAEYMPVVRDLFRIVNLFVTLRRALEVAAAQLDEEFHPTEFTCTSRQAAQRVIHDALAALRAGGEENEG